jgi:hypothetical protein
VAVVVALVQVLRNADDDPFLLERAEHVLMAAVNQIEPALDARAGEFQRRAQRVHVAAVLRGESPIEPFRLVGGRESFPVLVFRELHAIVRGVAVG